ncbi:MAG: single-stranded DNA-binding protein [Labilithrix sp.]|nr:single-stranded DNA-binding protein [Labilithrix sp.]MCW5816149.1 single-stranded DNA-binding protein [Labilithrix sp.]
MADDLVTIMERLAARTKPLRFGPPVAFVYHPLEYAWPVARAYFERYGKAPKEVLLLGMNPGPFGMGQTGVPFGEVASVRDFLRLDGTITPPANCHDKRPVLGWDCTRSEVSGQRLWGAFARKHGDAGAFFRRAFVLNYCPLLFLGETGANVTPDKIAKEERKAMEAICDEALAEAIAVLAPKHLVGIGAYAAKRLALVTGREPITMPHPSPASPTANRGWDEAARKSLTASGLDDLL